MVNASIDNNGIDAICDTNSDERKSKFQSLLFRDVPRGTFYAGHNLLNRKIESRGMYFYGSHRGDHKWSEQDFQKKNIQDEKIADICCNVFLQYFVPFGYQPHLKYFFLLLLSESKKELAPDLGYMHYFDESGKLITGFFNNVAAEFKAEVIMPLWDICLYIGEFFYSLGQMTYFIASSIGQFYKIFSSQNDEEKQQFKEQQHALFVASKDAAVNCANSFTSMIVTSLDMVASITLRMISAVLWHSMNIIGTIGCLAGFLLGATLCGLCAFGDDMKKGWDERDQYCI